ncbi:MAG: ATP-dependent helicase [Lachnospirales bacterium]
MDYLQGLNKEQKQGVLQTEGPLLIIAGAGSGKTLVLTHRISHLIEQGIMPSNILAITFTNKAAKEMKERAVNLNPKAIASTICTFHSFCVRVLRRELNILGLGGNFVIYDGDDSLKVIRAILKEKGIEKNERIKPKSVLSYISGLKNDFVTPEEAMAQDKHDYYYEILSEIYMEYEKALIKYNAFDFNDILLKAVQLFDSYPNVLEKYQEKFKYIMVDEYQDTNTVQYMLVRQLAFKYKNICVVGDDDQSIYGWRGADITNILNFEKDYSNAKMLKLEQNYRSTNVILKAANNLIKHNKNRRDKNLWSDSTDSNPIICRSSGNDFEEARFVVSEIQKITKDNKFNEIAILYRTNNQSRLFEDEFIRLNIPYQIYGGVKFYDRKEVKDILAYLKYIYNTKDEISLKRIINEPKRSIGTVTVGKLDNYSNINNTYILNVLKDVGDIKEFKNSSKKLTEFYKLIEYLIDFSSKSTVKDLTLEVIKATKYEDELLLENTDEARTRISNIYELVAKADEFNKIYPDGTLGEFLEEVSLVADVDAYDENTPKVVLMTLHTSKGLEFENVFLVGLEENLFPSINSSIDFDLDDEKIEEERRLMYVGITRAKKKLYLTNANCRRQFGNMVYNKSSRFIDEIPKDLLDLPKEIKSKSTSSPSLKSMLNSRKTTSLKDYFDDKPKNKSLDFEVGDKVRHMKYGVCEVLEITPAGADFQVKLNTKLGEKSCMGILARLKKA